MECQLDKVGYLYLLLCIGELWLELFMNFSCYTGQFPKNFVSLINLPHCQDYEQLLFALDPFFSNVEGDLSFDKGMTIYQSNTVEC